MSVSIIIEYNAASERNQTLAPNGANCLRMRTTLLLTHNSDDEELAHEQNEVGDLVHHSEADDVAEDETEGREGRDAKVLAVHRALQERVQLFIIGYLL